MVLNNCSIISIPSITHSLPIPGTLQTFTLYRVILRSTRTPLLVYYVIFGYFSCSTTEYNYDPNRFFCLYKCSICVNIFAPVSLLVFLLYISQSNSEQPGLGFSVLEGGSSTLSQRHVVSTQPAQPTQTNKLHCLFRSTGCRLSRALLRSFHRVLHQH